MLKIVGGDWGQGGSADVLHTNPRTPPEGLFVRKSPSSFGSLVKLPSIAAVEPYTEAAAAQVNLNAAAATTAKFLAPSVKAGWALNVVVLKDGRTLLLEADHAGNEQLAKLARALAPSP
jgi:hypothetical protein